MSKATASPHEPHFFKIILPGLLQQLPIPKAFIRDYFQGQNCERKATLRICRSSQSWDVSVNKFGCFTTGWEDFATQHNIQIGDFLVFKHEGNFVFRLLVFDRSACERKYPCQDAAAEDAHMNIMDKSVTNTSRTNLVKNNGVQDDPPCCTVVIRPSGIERGAVDLPTKFARDNGLINKIGMITLRDQKGKSWKVRLLYYNGGSRGGPRKESIKIGSGWRAFSDAKKLKVGDVCTIKLVSKKSQKVVLEVAITPSKSSGQTH